MYQVHHGASHAIKYFLTLSITSNPVETSHPKPFKINAVSSCVKLEHFELKSSISQC